MEEHHYKHFALPNVFLRNGYNVEEDEEFGALYSYENLDGLEDCVRLALTKTSVQFKGPHVRFLRFGLKLTQKEFARRLEINEQTLARCEKSIEPISRSLEIMTRSLYLNERNIEIGVSELWDIVDRRLIPLRTKLIFMYSEGRWTYSVHKLASQKTTYTAAPIRNEDLSSKRGAEKILAFAPVTNTHEILYEKQRARTSRTEVTYLNHRYEIF